MRLLPRRLTDRSRPPRGSRPGTIRRALLLWGLLLTAFAGGLVFLFFYSAAFVVTETQVAGVQGEVAESVEDLADIPRGRPLGRVSESKVRERVVAGDKRVADVTIDKTWPSTVTFEVTLREPALALVRGKKTWVADASGVVYDQVDKASNKLPRVAVKSKPEDLSQESVVGLVELWRLRPDPADLEGELAAPSLTSDGRVLLSIDQLTVEWGTPTEAEKKWQVVQALVGQESVDPQGGIPQTIDVSLPDTPVVTGLPPAAG